MKTVMLLEPAVPVRVSNEEALLIVERDGSGMYIPKKVYKDWVKAQKAAEGGNE